MIETDIELSSNPMIPWANRVNDLYNNPRYMELFLNLAQAQVERGHLVLALADRVEFLKQCHDILEDSMLVIGGSEDRDFLGSGKNPLLGTTKIFAEGVNIPPLSSLIMGMPLNNRGLLEQLLGRISRPFEGKLQPEAIDIMLKGKTAKNQAVQRINFYSEKNLKIKYI
jgi:superfamily II DNA or RNA helicase